MREIVLDTETTGFDPETGDRIVEIGAIELHNHLPTGRTFHVYINPERSMPQEAFDVHGLGDDFLKDKPKFAEIAQDFEEFIGDDGQLVIHNAPFDMKFLNAELRKLGRSTLPMARATDTLEMARRKFPGRRTRWTPCAGATASTTRTARCTAHFSTANCWPRSICRCWAAASRVWCWKPSGPATATRAGRATAGRAPRAQALAPRLTEAEAEAHAAFVAKLGDKAVWLRYGGTGSGS
ncbi:DNA polymerase III subunit epsilon [Paracoccus cavernae]|uniref:DNA polymerase III subunit epsilon n=1 Tax=Paracoccus cavernae TaxID=1571207 RepID=A0ABT8DAC7_9RHOB|nr:DNA polymerase III subunit epsilon [Paracoccus cavernae]